MVDTLRKIIMKNTPYTYLIGWTKLNKFYYGRRTAKNCHPDDLFITYFTSSKEVHRIMCNHGRPDVIKVRKTFNDVNKCVLWEDKVLRRLRVRNKSIWINHSNNVLNFGKPKSVVVKDKFGNNYCVSLDDPEYLSGELVQVNIGKSYGKGVSRNKGMIVTKDKAGNRIRVRKDDPRVLSGELVHFSKGVPMEKGWVAVKHSIDRSIKARVRNDDPRYLSGEWISVGKNTVQVLLPDGKLKRIEDNDPRYLSGELTQHIRRTIKGSPVILPIKNSN